MLIDGEANAEEIHLSARILARFSAGRDAEQKQIEINTLNGSVWPLDVKPLKAEEILKEWYV